MTGTRKTAVVTGGSSGIGREIVKRLLLEEYRVAFIGLRSEKVEEAIGDISSGKRNSECFGRSCDLQRPEAIQEFFTEVKKRFGNVGILINNAGISPKIDGKRIPTHKQTLNQVNEVLAVNLIAPFLCVKHVIPDMMSARFGRIIMVGSQAARAVPRIPGSPYVMSKAALAGFARSLAAEYGEYGITTNVVSPGNILTNMTANKTQDELDAAIARIPIGRMGMPEDFPGLISYLCSPEAAFVNGATIDVTGGEFMTP